MSEELKQSENADVKRLGEMVAGITYGMLTSQSAEGEALRSRPMTLQRAEFDGDFWFFAAKNGAPAQDIRAHPLVNISFAHPGKDAYVSVSGRADVVEDREKAKELWSPLVKAWFPQGPEDPNLALIRVRVESADYWDVKSSKLVQLYGFAKSILTGQPPGAELGVRKHVEADRAAG